MVRILSRNLKNNDADFESYLLSEIGFLDRTKSLLRIKKFVLRKTKHYLHTLQLTQFKNKEDKTVNYIYGISNSKYPGYIKIGFTQSMESRLADFRVYSPEPDDIRIVSYRPTLNGRFTEKKMHALFEQFRVNGEWFYITESDFKSKLNANFELEFQIDNYVNRLYEWLNGNTKSF